MLFLERLEEYFEGGERVHILIRIDVPDLRGAAKPACCKTGSCIFIDLCEFHIFLHTEHPSGDCYVDAAKSGCRYDDGF